MRSDECTEGKHQYCNGQVGFATFDSTPAKYPCTCNCHKHQDETIARGEHSFSPAVMTQDGDIVDE